MGVLSGPGVSAADGGASAVTGYWKTLTTSSRAQASDEAIFASLNRLRLEFDHQADPWQFHISLDNEAIFNDFANTADFDLIRSRTQDRLAAVDLDKVSVDNDHLYLKHSIYRAYVKYYQPEFQAVVGKQSVDWGRLRFYSPLDVFDSVGALDLEQDERPGLDAVNLNFSPEAFAGVNVVAAPGETDEESSGGVKLYKTISTYDAAIIAAMVHKDQIYGFLFDGYLKGAGFRGELTHTLKDDHRTFFRAAVGLDYTFNDKLYALVEYFYNGGHDDNDTAVLTSSYRRAQEVLSYNRHLSSLWLKYTLTPLWDLNQYVIYDWDGQSVVVNPELSYDLTRNIDLRLGTQLFFGPANSEFGDLKDLYYLELKWFF